MMGMLSVNLASCGSDDDDEPTPPASLSVTPTEISLLSEKGSSASFTITTNGAWVVSCASDWLHLSARNGNGNSMVTVTALTENFSSEVRTAQIQIQVGSLSQVVIVSQVAGLSGVKVVPVNTVALYNQLAWEMEQIGTVNEFRVLCITEVLYNRMNNEELKDSLINAEPMKYNDEYVFSYPDDSYDVAIKSNTNYYICTVAFDMDNNMGEIVRTKVTTPPYVDRDNDAWAFPMIYDDDVNPYAGFQFTVTKEGYCNTYHAIYGCLPFLQYRSLFAFEINYYKKYGKKHWFANSWGLEIVTDYPNSHMFIYHTSNLNTNKYIVNYGWGMYEDGRVSSDLVGYMYDMKEKEYYSYLAKPRGIEARSSDSKRNMVIRRSVEEARAKKYR